MRDKLLKMGFKSFGSSLDFAKVYKRTYIDEEYRSLLEVLKNYLIEFTEPQCTDNELIKIVSTKVEQDRASINPEQIKTIRQALDNNKLCGTIHVEIYPLYTNIEVMANLTVTDFLKQKNRQKVSASRYIYSFVKESIL